MQGGASDGAVHLTRALEKCQCQSRDDPAQPDKKQLLSPPLDTLSVEKEIMISPMVDSALVWARQTFATALALPIALIHLDCSVTACRERKQRRVREGVEQILIFQAICRSSFASWYFSCWSFFAEEEFYLLICPIFFWNIDYRFARHLTLIVCFGLMWGNLLKDVFRLPRPRNVDKKVWIPQAVLDLDSAACRDFGYPSTHAMNSISNSLFGVLYCLQHGIVATGTAGFWVLTGFAACWVFSISIGRLYLGVHSPMDVKGGLVLGLVIAFTAQWPLNMLDLLDRLVLMLPAGHVEVYLTLVFTTILILNPQPRPMTPTFLQNCTVSGLIVGIYSGFYMETSRRAMRLGDKVSYDHGTPALILRTLLGYIVVLMARTILKTLCVNFFKLIGLQASPGKPVPRKEAADMAKRQEIRGWDLWAAAVTKTMVYVWLAWTIVCGCPTLFDVVLGLPCDMNG